MHFSGCHEFPFATVYIHICTKTVNSQLIFSKGTHLNPSKLKWGQNLMQCVLFCPKLPINYFKLGRYAKRTTEKKSLLFQCMYCAFGLLEMQFLRLRGLVHQAVQLRIFGAFGQIHRALYNCSAATSYSFGHKE